MGGAAAIVPPPDSPVVWSIRRPPPLGVRLLGWVLGAALTLGGAWLLRSLMLEPPAWWIALLVGSVFGVMIPLALGHGASARVHAGGELVYGYGRRPNALIPLAEITHWAMVDQGLVRGIGIKLARPEAVRFLHRKGISYATMRRYQETCGMDLVLEFLTRDDLDQLSRIQADQAA